MSIIALNHTDLSGIQFYNYYSPMGILNFGIWNEMLVKLNFGEYEKPLQVHKQSYASKVVEQLDAYFQGDLTEFDLNIGVSGTLFDQQVWSYVYEIPFGEQKSYGEIARKFENIQLSRAVGSANGRNKILIVIPCHRVVGKNGSLVGYAGGMQNKNWLLSFEKNQITNQLSIF